MLLLLFFLLIILAVIALSVNGKDILSPSFVLIVFFAIGAAFAFYGNLNWQIEINDSRFILAILSGLTSILIGSLLVQKKNIYLSSNISMRIIDYNHVRFIILLLVNILILYLFYKRIYAIAVATGFSGENMQMYARVASSIYGVKLGIFFTFFIWILQASSIVCVYAFINNFFVRKRIVFKDGVLLIPVILYFIQIFYSGSRAGIIRFFIILLFFIVLSYRNVYKKINLVKILVTALITLSILLYTFAWLGTFTKKTDESDFLNPICNYVGSSIIALDDWLQRDHVFTSDQFGEGSFHGLYLLINHFQKDWAKTSSSGFNFIRKGKFSTNIYTGFSVYLREYGWPGMVLICLFLGIFFQYWYQYIIEKTSPLIVMIYGYFLIDFLYLLFAPSITSNLFTPTSIMGLIWLILIFKYLICPEKVEG